MTLIEIIVSMVLVAIIVGATIYFVYPVRQAVDLAVRAELTDAADNALQRIGREVRAALPNSVRVPGGSGTLLEFIPVRTAGRYRADAGGVSGGTDCPATADAAVPASDKLSFGFADGCFKSLGTIPNSGTVTLRDFLVLNNYGEGFTGQDAYAAAGTNRRQVSASAQEGTTRHRIEYLPTTAFDAALHDSAGKRFFIVNGRAAGAVQPEPVSFECNIAAGTLTRFWGYDLSAAQPTTFATGTSALLVGPTLAAPNSARVDLCTFSYVAGAAPQIGLLTITLQLSKVRSDGQRETISLYHAIHVSNVP